jgi:hypothetical protein
LGNNKAETVDNKKYIFRYNYVMSTVPDRPYEIPDI